MPGALRQRPGSQNRLPPAREWCAGRAQSSITRSVTPWKRHRPVLLIFVEVAAPGCAARRFNVPKVSCPTTAVSRQNGKHQQSTADIPKGRSSAWLWNFPSAQTAAAAYRALQEEKCMKSSLRSCSLKECHARNIQLKRPRQRSKKCWQARESWGI